GGLGGTRRGGADVCERLRGRRAASAYA
ncbi:unnamed protein product, partial [Tetraodon nigroviridis]